uniref:sulfiredoxin n=1 Tax=Aegilops tauschii subsp. strangulata TaxID=200361 RepID=A0A453QVT8_AEGTS
NVFGYCRLKETKGNSWISFWFLNCSVILKRYLPGYLLKFQIDVLEVDGVYYGFSGCHRYEAHQRLGLPTIRCKVRRGTKETLRHHMR